VAFLLYYIGKMPQKKNAVNIWLNRDIVKKIDEKLRAEHLVMNRTECVEQVMLDWAEGRLVRADSISTEKLFVTMLAMGIIDKPRYDQMLSLIRSGTLSAAIPEDKFGLTLVSPPTD
jgi:hypothetical protein